MLLAAPARQHTRRDGPRRRNGDSVTHSGKQLLDLGSHLKNCRTSPKRGEYFSASHQKFFLFLWRFALQWKQRGWALQVTEQQQKWKKKLHWKQSRAKMDTRGAPIWSVAAIWLEMVRKEIYGVMDKQEKRGKREIRGRKTREWEL